jgi:hypothetical protein
MAENAARGIGVKEVRRIRDIARANAQQEKKIVILLPMILSTSVVSFLVI